MRPLLAAVLLALLATPAFAASSDKNEDAAIVKATNAFFAAWNQHDVTKMVTYWADDATLINPQGHVANGKTEIQKLLSDEQTTVFKTSTANLVNMKISRSLGSKMALCDGDMTVDGAVGPDGSAMPQMKIHLAVIMAKHGSAWVLQDARPYAFLQAPGAPAN